MDNPTTDGAYPPQSGPLPPVTSPSRSGATHDPELPALRFEDLFDLAEIQQIQDAFAQATGVASVITDPQGVPITRPSNFCTLCQIIRSTEIGLRNCMYSDAVLGQANKAGPSIQPCLSGGLLDGGTSIMVGEHHLANWLIGQVFDTHAGEATMLDYAREIRADETQYREALQSVKHMSREQFRHVCEALFLIARQLSHLALRNLQQARHIAEQQQIEQERAAWQEQVIQAQQAAIGELSAPLLPLAPRVVALPLIGSVDSTRAQMVMEVLLTGVAQHQAEIVIVDITGVRVVDTQVAQALVRAAQAVKLLGAQIVLTGISPALAQTLVHLGTDLQGIITRSTFQEGIAFALK